MQIQEAETERKTQDYGDTAELSREKLRKGFLAEDIACGSSDDMILFQALAMEPRPNKAHGRLPIMRQVPYIHEAGQKTLGARKAVSDMPCIA